jgi:putative ABC transport system substrate-binding protein
VRSSQRGRQLGFLGAGTPIAWKEWVAAFVQRLHELNWIEGRTVKIEYRWAEGNEQRYTELAAEFVRLKVDCHLRSRCRCGKAGNIGDPNCLWGS